MQFTKRKGVIAAGSKYTAQAGTEILEKGGNAFDAASRRSSRRVR